MKEWNDLAVIKEVTTESHDQMRWLPHLRTTYNIFIKIKTKFKIQYIFLTKNFYIFIGRSIEIKWLLLFKRLCSAPWFNTIIFKDIFNGIFLLHTMEYSLKNVDVRKTLNIHAEHLQLRQMQRRSSLQYPSVNPFS